MIYYELLKPDETINTERRQQMINLNQVLYKKQSEYQKRQHKVILLHDNAPSYTAKLIKETIEAFGWEILSHAAYSSDLAPSDYHLFASMGHALNSASFLTKMYENVYMTGLAQKSNNFFGVASTNYQTGGKNV